MKKFLFVSNTSWSIYNFRLELMKALKSRGFKVCFCAPYDEYTEVLKKKGFEYFKINLDRKGKNPLRELITLFSFWKIYRKTKPDLILHFTIKPVIYGSIAARLNKIKFVNTITGLGSIFVSKNWQTKIVEILYKLALSCSYKVFFQNKDDLKFFLERGIIKKDKTVLVPGSGVNTKHFHPGFCNKIKRETKNFVFLYLGRIIKDKGVEVLVKAFEKVKEKYPSVELWLLGYIDKDNPSAISEEEIREWEKRNLVKYFEPVSDVRPFICQSDCIVLPSFYKEGVPRSLLEASSMEKPIITTDTAGCREVVRDKVNGFLVLPKEIDSLFKAMLKMVNLDEKKKEEMGKNGRKIIEENFDERKVIEKYLENIF